MPKVTYIYWRHYQRHSETEDSLTEALERARHDEDGGYAAPEAIVTASGKVIDSDGMDAYWRVHQQREKHGHAREFQHLRSLKTEEARLITWREASMMLRRLRWKPFVARVNGKAVLMANVWSKEKRVASLSTFMQMTPADFWQRLRHMDAYRVAEVERNIF